VTVHRGSMCEKPALNETRPPAAIAKCLVVFRVMNAELNNMRCRHTTSTADMPPDGFNIRRSLVHRTIRARPSRAPAFTPTFYRSRSSFASFSIYTRKTHSCPFPFWRDRQKSCTFHLNAPSALQILPNTRVMLLSHTIKKFIFRFSSLFDDTPAIFIFRFCERKTKIAGVENKCGAIVSVCRNTIAHEWSGKN